MIGVFIAYLFNNDRKQILSLMLSQKTHLLFLILFSIRIVQNYLIMSLSDFLNQFSLRLFVCSLISLLQQILFQAGLVCLAISDPLTYIQITLI